MERLRAENEAEEVALSREAERVRQEAGGRQGDGAGKVAFREIKEEELEGLDEEEQMKLFMGFEDFGSTKGKAVEDNHNTAAKGVAGKNKTRKYRQYMNRKGGFNRPLEKMT